MISALIQPSGPRRVGAGLDHLVERGVDPHLEARGSDRRSDRLTRSPSSGRTPRGSGDHQPSRPPPARPASGTARGGRRQDRARLEVGADADDAVARRRPSTGGNSHGVGGGSTGTCRCGGPAVTAAAGCRVDAATALPSVRVARRFSAAPAAAPMSSGVKAPGCLPVRRTIRRRSCWMIWSRADRPSRPAAAAGELRGRADVGRLQDADESSAGRRDCRPTTSTMTGPLAADARRAARSRRPRGARRRA